MPVRFVGACACLLMPGFALTHRLLVRVLLDARGACCAHSRPQCGAGVSACGCRLRPGWGAAEAALAGLKTFTFQLQSATMNRLRRLRVRLSSQCSVARLVPEAVTPVLVRESRWAKRHLEGAGSSWRAGETPGDLVRARPWDLDPPGTLSAMPAVVRNVARGVGLALPGCRGPSSTTNASVPSTTQSPPTMMPIAPARRRARRRGLAQVSPGNVATGRRAAIGPSVLWVVALPGMRHDALRSHSRRMVVT